MMDLSVNKQEYVWSLKYRPQTINECILPKKIKEIFQQFVDQKEIPNLLLTGNAGVGKTTAALALLKELGCDSIMINGSLNGSKDTLRTEITDFATSVSFTGGRKFVIIDEADYLSPAVQAALRGFIEEYASNCGIIFTANYPAKIIAPLHSRFTMMEFNIPKDEKIELMKGVIGRCTHILKQEGVDFDVKAVAALVKESFPDFRKILNTLQSYAASGKIDEGITAFLDDFTLEPLVAALKGKKFNDVRKWIAENNDLDFSVLCGRLYEYLNDRIEPGHIPALILLLNEFDYKNAFVVNKEINTTAMMVQLMKELKFK